jgi:hydrogenase-4 membrane subunit HyfE
MAESAEHVKDDEARYLLWRAAERASSWALQGQVTVQSRFGNFLLADSFLLLSWATVYSGGSRTTSRIVVLAVLALTSVLLGAVFALLGSRYAKYDRLQWDLAVEADRRLPVELRLIDRVDALRQNQVTEGPTGRRYQMSAAERLVSISGILVWVPAGLCSTSLVLFAMSFLPR